MKKKMWVFLCHIDTRIFILASKTYLEWCNYHMYFIHDNTNHSEKL